jgi:integral membrane protein
MDTVTAAYNKTLQGVGFVYHRTHWFTDREAWALFRLFAILEAVGWTLLIGAIIYQSLGLPQHESVIIIAGRMHGMFFVLYFSFVLLTARSMEWGFWRVTAGLAMGVGPYTSLIFEQIMAYHRKKHPIAVTPPVNVD